MVGTELSPDVAAEVEQGPPSKLAKLGAYERQEIVSHGHVLTADVELVEYHTIQIQNPTDIPRLLRLLEPYPIDQFVRRIYSLTKRILVAPVDVDISNLKTRIAQEFDDSIVFHRQMIPKTRPLLRIQHERIKDLWPVKFTARQEFEDVYQRKILKMDEVDVFVDMFKEIDGSLNCIVYDDNLRKVIATAEYDERVACGHACMMVAEKIADCCRVSQGRYYAHGCTAILSQEPCVMCAMALNHLRINRIFFLRPNLARGAFTRSRNILRSWDSHHRYDVYQVLRY